MEVIGEEGSAAVEMETKRMGEEQRDQREEKSPIPQEELDIMRLTQEREESDISAGLEAVELDADNSQRNTTRLLHLACKFDSTTSLGSLLEGMPLDTLDNSGYTALHYAAEHHSVRCIELLLKRRAKTDVKSSKGLTALEIALRSSRMQIISWSPADKITELLTLTGDKVKVLLFVFYTTLRDEMLRLCQLMLDNQDLTAIKILAGHTRDVVQVASRLIVHGNIVAFAALLTVNGDTLVSTPVLSTEEHGDGTLFDVIVKKAIAVGQQVQDDESDMKSDGCSVSNAKFDLRQTLLKELELLLRWHLDHHQDSDSRNRTPPTLSVPSPLMRAVQAGDIAVTGLLVDHQADVNETDSAGNTALHWSLRATLNTRDIRLVLKLVRNGASVTMGNRLGLTPVHIAAGQGHLQGLQILLAVEPSSVHVTAQTKETPLFSAVKGNHYDCVRLLLQHGACRQVLNLRKQRPIDVADTSDMRALLSLQEPTGSYNDDQWGLKDLNLIRSPMMATFESDYAHYDTEQPRFKSEASQLLEFSDESSKSIVPAKTEMCRYFSMPGGCVRGDKCFYAHGEDDLQARPRTSSGEIKQRIVPFNTIIAPARMVKRGTEDLSKKIFVGGLSPSVESDDLREFFEGKFGAVADAIVIGSHAGDHIQSRGFGFVTFKHEESVVAAVQAHYVNIFGKKVEIKDAVPRSVLPTLECTKGAMELSTSSSSEFTKFTEVDSTKVLDLSSLELLCQSKSDLQLQLMNYMGYQAECGPLPLKLSPDEEPVPGQGATSSTSPNSSFIVPHGATWVAKFKQWLPKFLAEVSNRLKEGEWYPLSSLKGDFRATCGLELDHVAIGYHKLSDFVRSIPESCRMKIVPVGRGPATHMVLLPALSRMTPTIPTHPNAQKLSGPSASTSLVDAGRSYAAAACQIPGKSTAGIVEPSVHSRSQPNPTRCSTSQFESHNVYDPVSNSIRSRYEDLRLCDSFLPLIQKTRNDAGHTLHTSMSQNQLGPPGSFLQEAEMSNMRDVTNLREMMNLLDNSEFEGQHIQDRVAAQGVEYLTTGKFESMGSNFMTKAHSESLDARIDIPQEDPKTPVNQVNLRPFSTFNHPFTGFLPQENISSYNMWGQQLQTSQTIMERRNPQLITGKLSDPIRTPWDDSPQSILFPYSRSYPPMATQEAPRSLFSPPGNSPTDDQAWAALCVYCRERRSLWVAIPCNHYALCAVCKDALHKLNRSTANCPVCENLVERWIALH